MLIVNGDGHREHWTGVPHQLILLCVTLWLLHLLWHLYIHLRLCCLRLGVLFLGVLSFLFLLHGLHLLMQLNCFLDHFQILLNLLFNHLIYCQNVVQLFGKNEYFDSAVGHARSHDSPRVR